MLEIKMYKNLTLTTDNKEHIWQQQNGRITKNHNVTHLCRLVRVLHNNRNYSKFQLVQLISVELQKREHIVKNLPLLQKNLDM